MPPSPPPSKPKKKVKNKWGNKWSRTRERERERHKHDLLMLTDEELEIIQTLFTKAPQFTLPRARL